MDPKLITGTLDLVILNIVSRGPSYGYQITQTAEQESRGVFAMKEGSLYPALHRLERQKLLTSSWGESSEGRRRKYYRITPLGKKSLDEKRAEWERFSGAVARVLGANVEMA